MHAAHQLADEFLSKDKLVVYTQGLNQPRADMIATEVGRFEKGRLIILVDEYFASASEIVSGAVQDWDRALLSAAVPLEKGSFNVSYLWLMALCCV